ncbi:hypothetical protein [Halarsenatibacter silvermanii]|uniref:Uncharacterized protein n=1 Tax=Halarsenatibacter silvermanii TaxID=321763 RepID=A0A1G9KTG6_9FIRM|nr:hypothetical protein [Halarsenatibacter silvermanii]SDL52803.1 hypothetical protein SAMN04488692_10595 [Halarsenatibacter silvermanii]
MSIDQNFKVARSILDLGIRKKELKENDNLGKKLRNVLIENYKNDKQKYKDRLNKMIEKASQINVDIMILPALSFIHSSNEKAADYLDMCKKIPWVISGKLEIREGRSRETCVIIENGNMAEEIDDATALGVSLNGIDSRIAVSSTIKKIRDASIEVSEINPCQDEPDYIYAFNIGHQQYTGRYRRTLKSITRELNKEAEKGAAVFLSYWKYIHASTYYHWLENLGNLDAGVNREHIEVENSAKKDYFDIIKVKQIGGNKKMGRKELVENIEEVRENLKRFEAAFNNGRTEITKKLSQFKRWYYDEKLDIFGPSKFIGYKEMQAEIYDNIYKNIDGRETEQLLEEFSREIEDEEKRKELLMELESRLSSYDKKINKTASVRILEHRS